MNEDTGTPNDVDPNGGIDRAANMAGVSENTGTPKNVELKDRINSTADMTVVLGGNGKIKSVEGGGRDQKVTSAEFNFEDYFLNCRDFEGGEVSSILDMKSYTFLALELRDAKGGSRIVNYLWESTRHWW